MTRHSTQRKISQEQLALAVKKDFNDAMISEPESITTFLYTVRNQGDAFSQHIWLLVPNLPIIDKSFRIHFKP